MKIPERVILKLLYIFGFTFFFSSQPFVWAQERPKEFPYEQCFTITGYYSPLPDQDRYATGSYQSEVRLEGRGTNGADGAQVYEGMLAAPPEIQFGTKILTPFGIGTVHDRGGAIKTRDGECGSSLDIWMGFGEKGLERTLNWGVRKARVTVYGVDDEIEENLHIEGYSELESMLREKILFFKPKNFTQDLGPGDSGDEVLRLQQKLKNLGYYKHEITGLYDDQTIQAVYKFQTEFDVLSNRNTIGAGYFGINTRTAMDRAIRLLEENQKEEFPINLGKGAVGPQVEKLQTHLTILGYLPKGALLSGMYDTATEEAVLRFQLNYKIISNVNEQGAGYFGPKTREMLGLVRNNGTIDNFVSSQEEQISNSVKEATEVALLETFPDLKESFTQIKGELGLGDRGESVLQLQSVLAKLGYFRHPITDYYGQITEHAVFKFQQAVGLVKTKNDPGAGRIGPNTVAKIKNITQGRIKMKNLIASTRLNPKSTIAKELGNVNDVISEKNLDGDHKISQANLFTRELKFGDRGDDVKLLQKVLKSLGFFQGAFLTDYFGEFTQNALKDFQIERGIKSLNGQGMTGKLDNETSKILEESIKNQNISLTSMIRWLSL